MRVSSIHWVGTRTDHHDQMVHFLDAVLGLRVEHGEPDFTVLSVPDGATVEVFGSTSPYNHHLEGPTVGFRVDDLDGAAAELEQAGATIVLSEQHGPGRRWLHFRAPDGFVYELVQTW